MAIEENKIVKIHYKGTLSDGTVFDSSEGREALEFIFGIGMIVPGLEEGILGLNIGDKKKVEVKAEDAYGPVIDQAIQEVPKAQFPADLELKEGMQLAAQGPQGVIPVMVKEIKDDSVIVDFNHPLAGKDLTFDVEIVDVKDASEEDKHRILGPLMGGGCGCSDSECGSKGGCGSDCHCGSDSDLEDLVDEKKE